MSTLIIAALAVALIVVLVQRQRLHGALRRLAHDVERMVDGAAEPPPPPPGDGSRAQLQRRFIAAAEMARVRVAAATDAQRQREEVLAGMVEGVLVVDGGGTVLFGNRRAEALLELPPDAASTGK